MKHLKIALLALVSIASFNTVKAQDVDNPWAVGFGINAVDFYPTGYDAPGIGDFGEEFFNVNNYNAIPSFSRITVGRHIISGLSVEIAGTMNKIERVGKSVPSKDLTYFGLDLAGRWSFMHKKDHWFDPYVLVGTGKTWLDSESSFTWNGGLGINFWFARNIGFNIESKYKESFDQSTVVIPHFQHSAGFVIRLGGSDRDGDRVYDKKDACPDTFGLPEFQGCPDTDGDGVPDKDDACIDIAGPLENNGCPDSDGDGVVDPKDACPDIPGEVLLNGCPDTDQDGVLDHQDECPDVAGPAENKGCPWPDADGDGVKDADDLCPDVVGVAENKGCPLVTEEVVKALDSYAKTIAFAPRTNQITGDSEAVLNDIVAILKEYPSAQFAVEGHTDSAGARSYNQKLSKSRAEAVLDYLASHGIDKSRLKAVGYGEDRPVASNNTKAGKAKNRRVDIKLIKQ